MNAREVIMILRSLLRDNDRENLFFSDGELLDKISSAQNEFISEFRENIHTFFLQPQEHIQIQRLAYIFECTLDSKPLCFKHISSALKSPYPTLYHAGGDRYVIHNFKGGEELRITASVFEPLLTSPSDELALGFEFAKALALRAYCDMLLVQTSPHNPQIYGFYKEALREEKQKIRALKNRANAKSTIFSTIQI
ncbi:hypothetical protein [uncultured Helicobacter sp.]|uniref:hypothetical protein n=1 Tax=uncultured Helicobacter sp. TaxID=175537 RepID=UPI00374F84CF